MQALDQTHPSTNINDNDQESSEPENLQQTLCEVNIKLSDESFLVNRERAVDYLNT